jgi:hypothetical protein
VCSRNAFFQTTTEDITMKNIAMGLVVLSVLGFLLAVAAVLVTGPIAGIGAEAFSRASANLALIAIGLIVVFPAEESGDA